MNTCTCEQCECIYLHQNSYVSGRVDFFVCLSVRPFVGKVMYRL